MNMKGIKFLAVLAVVAMAFTAFATVAESQQNEAANNAVASVTVDGQTTEYDTISDAIYAAQPKESGNKATVTILSNFTLSSGAISFTKPGEYILDTNGKTITISGATYGFTVGGSAPPVYPIDTINTSAKLTIVGNGTINSDRTVFRSYGTMVIGDSEGGPTVTISNASPKYSIFKVEEGSYMTVNGGTFNVSSDSSNKVTRVMQSYGTTVINGGTFGADLELWKYGTAEKQYDSTITINGGTFGGAKISISGTDGAGTLGSGDVIRIASGTSIEFKGGKITGGTLEVEPDAGIVNTGELTISGQVVNNGSVVNQGTITVNKTFTSNGVFMNTGTVNVEATGVMNAVDAGSLPLPVAATIASGGKVQINGTDAKINTTTVAVDDTAIKTALTNNDVVIVNIKDNTATKIEIPTGKVLVINNVATFTATPTITIPAGSELVLNDTATTKTYNLVSGNNTASLSGVTGAIAFTFGSIAVTGTVTAGSISVSGDVDAYNLAVSTGTVSISSTTGAEILLDDVVIDSGKLTITGAKIAANSSVEIMGGALEIGTTTAKADIDSLTVTGPGSANTVIYGDAESSYFFPEGQTVTGTYSIGEATYFLTDAKAGNGGFTISANGLSGNVASATKILMDKGVVSGLTISGNTNFAGTYTIAGRVTVAAGATLDIGKEAIAKAKVTVKSNAVITVNGVVKATAATNLENNGTIVVNSNNGFDATNMTITGEGIIEYGEAENVYISGTISDTGKIFGEKQIVTVIGNLNIKAGCNVTFNGQLIINEGITVTIEEGASITISGAAARLTNNGTIVLDAVSTQTANPAALTGSNNAVLTNNGTISLSAIENKATSFTTGGKLTNNGLIIVGEYATMTGNLVNATEGIVTIGGGYTGTIENYAAVAINGTVGGTIKMMSRDAGVLITKLAYTESGLTITADKKIDTKIGTDVGSVTFAPANGYALSGAIVAVGTEKVSSTGTGLRAFIDLSGEIAVSSTTDDPVPTTSTQCAVVTIASNKTVVSDSLTLDKYTDLVVNGTLLVTGTLDSEFTASSIGGTGTFTVTGAASVLTVKADVATIEAAQFSETVGTVTTHYYTTLAKAIDAGATPIVVTGKQTISSDVTIPAGTKVTFSAGANTTVSKGAVLTVKNGATLVNSATITVNGKMVVENKKDLKGNGSVVSDVMSALGDSQVYTGLETALNEAAEGSVVTLRKNVELTSDLTIPDLKGLDVDSYTITVKGATLTVDGMLYLRDKGIIVQDSGENKGKLKVTGIVVSDTAFTSKGDDAPFPAGAYYSVVYESAPYYCMSPIAVALENEEIIEGNIALYGEKLALGIIEANHNIDVYGNIVSGIITIDDGYTITAKNIIGISATIGNTEGSILMKEVAVSAGTAFASSAKSVLSVKGDVNATNENYPVTFSGNVSVAADVYYAYVIGDVIITDSVTMGDLAIDGTVTVNNGKTLTIGDDYWADVEVLIVNGSLIVKEKLDDGSVVKIVIKFDVYIGIDYEIG